MNKKMTVQECSTKSHMQQSNQTKNKEKNQTEAIRTCRRKAAEVEEARPHYGNQKCALIFCLGAKPLVHIS